LAADKGKRGKKDVGGSETMKARGQSRLVGMLLGIAVTMAPAPAYGEKGAQKVWSTEWEAFWPLELGAERQLCLRSSASVAASADVVALAIGRACEPTSMASSQQPRQPQIWLIVLFFNAHTGKLLAEREPQRIDFRFELLPTAEGNFLLHLHRGLQDDSAKIDSLILISPVGRTLNSIEMHRSQDESSMAPCKVFISPSRRTILVTRKSAGSTHYLILDSNALEVRSEWLSRDPAEPRAISVSDGEMLGESYRPPRVHATGSTLRNGPQFFVRTIEGSWRPLQPATIPHVSYSRCAFLNNDAIAILGKGHPPSGRPFMQLSLLQANGQIETSRIIRKSSWYDLGTPGQIQESVDGNYFLNLVGLSSSAWQTFDVYVHHVELYVWKKKELAQVMKVTNLGNLWGFCLVPDGSRIVILDGKALKAYALP
jgi:hypothetical protein